MNFCLFYIVIVVFVKLIGLVYWDRVFLLTNLNLHLLLQFMHSHITIAELFGFVQDSKQLNRNGIGLGLVIADNIVNQFDGKITFDSVPKEGSTFEFTFLL